MTEKSIRQLAQIRKRSADLDKMVIGDVEHLAKALNPSVSPCIPAILREHMLNSVEDTKVLLAAVDESVNNVDVLLTEVQRLTVQLKKHRASSELQDEHSYKPKLEILINWMDGHADKFQVGVVEVNKETNSLNLRMKDCDLYIPMSAIRYYVITSC